MIFINKKKTIISAVMAIILAVAFIMTSLVSILAYADNSGAISLSKTYDSDGNAIHYNSGAVINGYDVGGTDKYIYRMFVDGESAFCIQPGVPLSTGDNLIQSSSDTWNALSEKQKKAVGLALLYGYQGNSSNLSANDDEQWLATQILVWEFVTGCREDTGEYKQTDTTVYQLYFGTNTAGNVAKEVYEQIVDLLINHNTIPSFLSESDTINCYNLSYANDAYSITLTDGNNVISDYTFSCSDSNIKISISDNKLTLTSDTVISSPVKVTAIRNNTPTVSESAKLIAYGDSNIQDVVTGVENADTITGYMYVKSDIQSEIEKKIVDGENLVESLTIPQENREITFSSTFTIANQFDLESVVIQDVLEAPFTYKSLAVYDSDWNDVTAWGDIAVNGQIVTFTFKSTSFADIKGKTFTLYLTVDYDASYDLIEYVYGTIPNTIDLITNGDYTHSNEVTVTPKIETEVEEKIEDVSSMVDYSELENEVITVSSESESKAEVSNSVETGDSGNILAVLFGIASCSLIILLWRKRNMKNKSK